MNDIDMAIVKERIKTKAREKGMTYNDLAEAAGVNKNTLEKWLYGNKLNDISGEYETYHISIDKAYNIAQALGVSIAYLIGEIESEHAENKDISNLTGLSYNAIECLRMWNQDRQQATTLDGIYAHDLDTLNTILEYYYNKRKEAAKKKRWANFSVFHFISIFLNTDNFERISNEHLDDPTHIDLLNTGNELEQYAVPVSGLLREYAIRQIEKALKKIGGIE